MPIIVRIVFPDIRYLNDKREHMNRIDFTVEQAQVTGYLHEDYHHLVEHKIRPAMVMVGRYVEPQADADKQEQ